MNSKINIEQINRFAQSTDTDGNFVGIYEGRVLRVINENQTWYEEILKSISKYPELIKSKIVTNEKSELVVEHQKLDYITYFNEWTRKQKVEAALSVINLQEKLSKEGYSLKDPHAFNITFEKSKPVYFDLGSIVKQNEKPSVWFLKRFCGVNYCDYWKDVLDISNIKRAAIISEMMISSSPYSILRKSVLKLEQKRFDRIVSNLSKRSSLAHKGLKTIKRKVPKSLSNLTNWSDYDQKDPALDMNIDRNKNILQFFETTKPEVLLDIGANKGAFCKLAIKSGAKTCIAVDLDEVALDQLREDIKGNNFPIYTAKLDMMNYEEKPGCFNSYLPAHERLNADYAICLAVVHHVCYFGNAAFEEFAFRLNRFVNKSVLVEFIPSDDEHLSGDNYKGKDRSWYTQENFIAAMKKHFPLEHEIFKSNPSPRILIQFNKQ